MCKGYFPKGNWYSLKAGTALPGNTTGRWLVLPAPLDTINIHVRGGSIIPSQTPATTTYATRRGLRSLTVALGDDGASGWHYCDDGVSVDSVASGAYTLVQYNATAGPGGASGVLKSTVLNSGYTLEPALASVRVLGVQRFPTSVVVNGATATFTYDSVNNVLTVSNLEAVLTAPLTMQWS